MPAVAFEHENDTIVETTGVVTAIDDGRIAVRTARGCWTAKRALSCLVVPAPGDLVLVKGPQAGDRYVVSVLERPGGGQARIAADGDLTVDLRSGRLTLAAAEGIDLVSGATVSVAADRLEARAREGSLWLESAKLVAGALDATIDRFCQTARRIYRRIADLEYVRAGQIDYASQGNLRLHGENTLVSARELVKADAKQIHVG